MECILLAGGTPRPGEPLWDEARGRPKALLDVAGRRMIDRVVDGLRAAAGIHRIILVGLPDDATPPVGDDLASLPDHGSLVGNLYAGIAALDARAPRAAYCWSDIPLVDGAMIDRFIAAADPSFDVSAGVVARELMEDRCPGVQDQWLRVREGQFVAADFGLFRVAAARGVRERLEVLMPRRKSPLRQARSLGLPLTVRFLTGRLTIPRLCQALERRTGLRCEILRVADPELGLDVDSVPDLELCRRAVVARSCS